MTENVKELQRIRTIGKVIRIVLTVFFVLALIGAGSMLIGALIFALLPESALYMKVTVNGQAEFSSSLPGWEGLMSLIEQNLPWNVASEGDKLIIPIEPDFSIDLSLTRICALGLFLGMVRTAVYAVVFFLVAKFGKVLQKNSTPFSAPCIRYLKITAYLLLGWALASMVFGGIIRAALTSGAFRGVAPDFGMLIVAGILLLIAYIFQYGAKLQQQSDETL